MVLRYGEPEDLHHVSSCANMFRDLEIWTYPSADGVGRQRVRYLFYRPEHLGPRRLWVSQVTPGRSGRQNAEIFLSESCRKTLQDLACGCSDFCEDDPCLGQSCPEACDVFRVYQEIIARQGGASFGFVETLQLFALPKISSEGLDQLRSRFPQLSNPNVQGLKIVGPSSRLEPEPTPTPEPKRLLTPEEIRDHIVKLDPKYRQFLDLAGPLLTQVDFSDFVQMSPEQRDRFIQKFWKSRE